MNRKLFDSVGHENLRILCILRLIPLAGMFYGAYYLLQSGNDNLQWEFIFSLLATLTMVIGLTWLRSFSPAKIRYGEFFGHLLIDVAIYSLLMFNTGGASNPFISYLLVPVTIAAVALPAYLTALIGAICLTSYSLLLFWHIPLPAVSPGHGMLGSHHGTALNLHIVGMWLNFIVSALLIAYFINRMARTIASQQKQLNQQQQQQLEDDQLLAVATVAASAAHELGTPLNTMKLIVDELLQPNTAHRPEEIIEDLGTFRSQIRRCQETLQKLSGTAREYTEKGERVQNVHAYFTELLDNWLLMRPEVKARIKFLHKKDDTEITYHLSLSASIHNLLNNAADASPQNVVIEVSWSEREAYLVITDSGKGFDADNKGQSPLRSEKPQGLGLGLFLSNVILSRHNASVSFQRPDSGIGTMTKVTLPLRP